MLERDLLEMAGDLEVNDTVIKKMRESILCTDEDIFEILDDSLDELEFIRNFVKTYVLDTETEEIYVKILSVLKETEISLDKIVEYVLNCTSETQFVTTLNMLLIAKEDIPVPEQETGELIYYGLIDIHSYIESLEYIYQSPTEGD